MKGEGPMRLTGVITGPFGNNAIFRRPGMRNRWWCPRGCRSGTSSSARSSLARWWSKAMAMSAH